MELFGERQFVMVPNLWVNLQFTHFCRDAGNVAIYALWEPKKTVNPGFRAKKNRNSSPASISVKVICLFIFEEKIPAMKIVYNFLPFFTSFTIFLKFE